MNVLAVRDDGALLVVDGDKPAGVIVSNDGIYGTTHGAALARGSWENPTGQQVPAEAEDQVSSLLAEWNTDLADEYPLTDVTAAAEVQTGAMIALIPSDADIARLAVPGGEPPEQLHLTLYYLGEAANYTDVTTAQLIERVADYVKNAPVVRGDGFALAIFNPAGSTQSDGKQREPCIVLEVSGDDVNEAHNAVCGAVDDFMGYNDLEGSDLVPEQHKPWIPHITLTYANNANLTEYLDKIGPVTFDKIRLAFAGENYDVPLGEESPAEDMGDLSEPELEYLATVLGMSMDDLMAFHTFGREGDVNVPGVGHNLRDYWTTGPGAAKIRWGTDGDFTRCTHHLAKYVKDPKGLCAEYHHRATGKWPHPHPHTPTEALEPEAFGGGVVPFEFDPHEPRDAHGRWRDTNPGGLNVGDLVDKVWEARHVPDGKKILSGVDSHGSKHDLMSNGDGSISAYNDYSDDAHSTFHTKEDLDAWMRLPAMMGGGTDVKWHKLMASGDKTEASAPTGVKRMKVSSAPDVSTSPALKQSLDRLLKVTSSPEVDSNDISNGEVGTVEKIKTKNGSYITKTSKDWGTSKAKDITDAEELASELGIRIGANVPAVERVNANTVNMEFVDGMSAGELSEFHNTIDTAAIADSPSSRMLGLLDLITLNQDRHDYNWIVNEEDDPPTAVGIDHGLSWASTPPNSKAVPSDKSLEAMIHAGESPFVPNFVPYDELFRRKDIEKARSALDAMEPRFKEMGKEHWLKVSRRILDLIEQQMDYTLGMQA